MVAIPDEESSPIMGASDRGGVGGGEDPPVAVPYPRTYRGSVIRVSALVGGAGAYGSIGGSDGGGDGSSSALLLPHRGSSSRRSDRRVSIVTAEDMEACEGAARSLGGGDPPQRPSLRRSFAGDSVRSVRSGLRSSLSSAARMSFRLGGRASSVRDVGGEATVSDEVFNLIKNIVGCGVLSLPNGIAAFANAPSAVFPASIIIVITGAIFGYYFHLLGRVCRMTQTATYREAWENSVGEAGSLIVALINTLKAALGNLAYSMILANTVRDILRTAGLSLTRAETLLIVTVVVLLPLCLFKNLKVLAPFSIIGLVGMLFTGVTMGIRYFDGSYDAARGGRFLADIEENLQPSFGTKGAGSAFTPQVLVLACMLFESFVAHYNAPRYYVELKRNTVQRFGAVTALSFGVSAAFFVLVAAFGFLTFGESCAGLILDNYSTRDALATLSRVGLAVAIAFTYPILFIGVRDGVMDIMMVPVELQTSQNLNALSVVLLTIITVLAIFVTDLGLLSAVAGGTLSTANVFVFPALMFRFAVRDLGAKAEPGQKAESAFGLALMCVGIAMGVIGVVMAFWGI